MCNNDAFGLFQKTLYSKPCTYLYICMGLYTTVLINLVTLNNFRICHSGCRLTNWHVSRCLSDQQSVCEDSPMVFWQAMNFESVLPVTCMTVVKWSVINCSQLVLMLWSSTLYVVTVETVGQTVLCYKSDLCCIRTDVIICIFKLWLHIFHFSFLFYDHSRIVQSSGAS